MTYSKDFRQHVLDYKEEHELTFEQTSQHFGISCRSLFRWADRVEPCVKRNKPATKVDMEQLKSDVEKYPDDYQWERAKRLGVTQSCIHYALSRLNITFKKKTLKHPKADEQARHDFIEKMIAYQNDNHSLVYIDESGFVFDMPREYGYSEKGKRCYGQKDWHAKGRLNAIGAVIEMERLTVTLFDSNINADIFYVWLTQDLLPKLPDKSVLIMDNARFHKREDIVEAISTRGFILEFLPAYSPDLNPIEHKWAEVKATRRRERCGIDELFKEHVSYAYLY